MDKEAELETAEEKGIRKGIEKGREEGIKQSKKGIAKKMKEKGIDTNTIKEITGLTKEEIENL